MNAEQLTPQTAEQHRIAQEVGNAAYEAVFDTSGKGHWNLRSATEAYQEAYQKSLADQQAASRPGYIVNPAAQMWGWIDSDDLPEDTPKDWNDTKGDCAL